MSEKHKDDFKVVIVGGGVAGLALANMLEKMDLNYVVLEKHRDIAPAVGASIGLFPNGLRILDQMGLFEKIKAHFEGEETTVRAYTRRPDGSVISGYRHFSRHLEKRHGYGLYFFDRQKLLQIMYDSLKHKERVLLNKGVSSVELAADGVRVICADGSSHSGSLVVGADGIHSAVRHSMRSLAAEQQPGYFDPAEEDAVPGFYRCSFGIAQDVPGWTAGEQHVVMGRGGSQLVVSGPENKVYWFLFDRLPAVKHGREIPTYTRSDEEAFVEKHRSTPVTETLTWGQVYDSKLSSTLTPLHEVVYKKWFFCRIITLGDSAHKPNPIGGQGGNGALESCAELINALTRLKHRKGGATLSSATVTTQDVIQVFTETQAARNERAKLIIKQAHAQQALFAHENPRLSAFLADYVLPHSGPEASLTRLAAIFPGGSTIESLPVPPRPRLIPFDDELPARPIVGPAVTLARGALVVAALGIVSLAGLRRLPWLGDDTEGVAASPTTLLRGVYSASQLISPLMLYAVEGHRVDNQGTLLGLPALFSALLPFLGIARVAPLHAVLGAFKPHDLPTGRAVPVAAARALVPAVVLGFMLPTALALLLPPPTTSGVRSLAVWYQAAPLLFNVLTGVFASGLRWWQSLHRTKPAEEDEDELMKSYRGPDVPYLLSAYSFAIAVQAIVHVGALTYGVLHPSISPWQTFEVLLSPFVRPAEDATGDAGRLVTRDMALAVAGYLISNVYAVWTLRRRGYITSRDAITAIAGVVAGQALVGPGATWAGLWYWRESVFVSLSSS